MIKKLEFLRFVGITQVFYIHFMTIFNYRTQFITWGSLNSSNPLNQGYTGFIILIFLSSYLYGLKHNFYDHKSFIYLIKKIINSIYKRFLRLFPGFLTAILICSISGYIKLSDLKFNNLFFFLPEPIGDHILGVTWTIPYDFIGIITMIFFSNQFNKFLKEKNVSLYKNNYLVYIWLFFLLIILFVLPKLIFVYPIGFTLSLILESKTIIRLRNIDKLVLNFIFISLYILFYYFNIIQINNYGYHAAILFCSIILSLSETIKFDLIKENKYFDKVLKWFNKSQLLFILLHYPTVVFIKRIGAFSEHNIISTFLLSYLITFMIAFLAHIFVERRIFQIIKIINIYNF